MKKNNSKLYATILGLVLFLATAGGFVWLWFSSQPSVASTTSSEFQTTDIKSTISQADKYTKGRDNLSGIPIQAPAAEQVGRTDPFAGL